MKLNLFRLEYPVFSRPEQEASGRMIELDFLRGLAILFVLLSHYAIISPFRTLWIGVDLFFVLSGFLVSGLLMQEYRKTGQIRPVRFLIRRGLKIYPSFYFFLFFTVGLTLFVRAMGIPLFDININTRSFLSEMFYLQNYITGIWGPDWSLAVEEHFYFLLTLLFVGLSRYGNVMKNVGVISILVILLITVVRTIWVGNHVDPAEALPLYSTHFRMDSLFAGVFLAWVYNSFGNRLLTVPVRIWGMMALGGLSLLVIWKLYFWDNTYQTSRLGYSVIYLSFGSLLFGLVMTGRVAGDIWTRIFRNNLLVRVISNIGVYSYNIYLWHMFVLLSLYSIVYVINGGNIFYTMAWRYLAAYLVLAVGTGYVASKLLEIPVLKWRDRVAPRPEGQKAL